MNIEYQNDDLILNGVDMFNDQMGAVDMLTKAITFTQGEKRLVTTAIFI